MCQVCRRYPCDPRCPNAPEPPKPRHVYVCSGCGASIKEGEYVWHILGEQFCETCIDKACKVAEYVED